MRGTQMKNFRKDVIEKSNKQDGITLIALVITIIIMIVLASVSINAIVGDNGIITQAQNATVQNSIANLEEYLQELYINNYETIESGNYESKVIALSTLYSSYFYIPKNDANVGGSMTYIVDSEGHALYLIQKSGLPDEIQEQLVGGDAGDDEYNDYASLIDVYGVTSDLKVYYCSNGSSTIQGITLAELDNDDPNRVIKLSSSMTALVSQISGAVNENGDITAQTIRAVTELTITASDGVTSLEDLYNFTCLKTLNLKELTSSFSMKGIENATILSKIYLYCCSIGDYSSMAGVSNLTYLYIHGISDDEFETLCTDIASAEYSKLNYLAVVGGGSTDYINSTTYIGSISSTYLSSGYQITSLEPLSKLSSTTKSKVKYLSINNNYISGDLTALSDYTSLIYLRCEYNRVVDTSSTVTDGITSLAGLEDMNDLVYLQAQYCNIGNGSNEADTSISSLSGKSALKYVYLRYNLNLAYVSYLNDCESLAYMYLKGCSTNMLANSISTALGRVTDYDLPVRWSNGYRYAISEEVEYINDEEETDYTVSSTDSEFYQIIYNDLYGNTNITHLNLENVQFTNTQLNTILTSMPNLQYLTLKGCSNLTTIDFVCSGGAIQLIELDLRNTGVTDLTNLNDYGTALKTLRVNCSTTHEVTETYYEYTITDGTTTWTTENLWETWIDGNTLIETSEAKTRTVTECEMDLSTIETVINHLDSTTTYWYSSDSYRGLVCVSKVCFKTLSKTTELTKLYSNQHGLSVQDTTIEVDLRNNKNLTSVTCRGWYFKVYLPKSVTSVNALGWPPIIRSWNWNYFILYAV